MLRYFILANNICIIYTVPEIARPVLVEYDHIKSLVGDCPHKVPTFEDPVYNKDQIKKRHWKKYILFTGWEVRT